MSAAAMDIGSNPNSPVAKKRKSLKQQAATRVPAEFIRQLLDTPAESFAIEGKPENMPIFICKRDDLVTDVWQGLINKNFLSVPVLLKSKDAYFGIFDLGDIVKFMVHSMGQELKESKDYMKLLRTSEAFKDKRVKDLMEWPLSRRNPFHPVLAGCSALMVVELLSKMKDLHRVPVIAPNREMMNFVTQSQVVRYLNDNIDQLGGKVDKAISECPQFFTDNVISVSEHASGIDAFMLMVEKRVSGIAVTHEDGRLSGHISLRDLKLIGHDALMFNRLNHQVGTCIKRIREEYQTRHQRPRTMVVAYEKDTIGDVIKKFAENGVHRLFVVKSYNNKQLLGVIALKDLFMEILA